MDSITIMPVFGATSQGNPDGHRDQQVNDINCHNIKHSADIVHNEQLCVMYVVIAQ